MKQRIGDITDSQRITVHQDANVDADQEVGAISNASDIALRQSAAVAVRDCHQEIAALLGLDARLLYHKESATVVMNELSQLVGVDVKITAQAVGAVEVPEGASWARFGALLRDLGTAASLVSGGLAIAQITDPLTLAVAVPAALAATGALQADRLKHLYKRIRTRLGELLLK